MTLWRTPEVNQQPSITLIRWRVLQVVEGSCSGQRHLVGFCLENLEGRVSTPIVLFHPEVRICVTRSGRRYHLLGPSEFDDDGQYVWSAWSKNIPTIDISAEFEMSMMNTTALPEN